MKGLCPLGVHQMGENLAASKLANLKPSFSSLEYEAKMSLILAIRVSRRTPKVVASIDGVIKPKVRKGNTTKRAPTKADAKSILAAFTPELAAELLAALSEE